MWGLLVFSSFVMDHVITGSRERAIGRDLPRSEIREHSKQNKRDKEQTKRKLNKNEIDDLMIEPAHQFGRPFYSVRWH